MRNVVLLLLLLSFMTSCSLFKRKDQGAGAIARVHERYMYMSDLEGLVPAGTPAKDSLEITQTYINNWIRQMLLLQQAEDNLDQEMVDFNREIEQYRNSLIIFRYESELVRQKLDTAVSMQEIEEYYNKNQENFRLHENITRAAYVILPRAVKQEKLFKQLMMSNKPADLDRLTSLCQQLAEEYSLDNETWLTFAELSRKIPVRVSDPEKFLSGTNWFETKDSTRTYLLRIREYKTKESVSPLAFEVNNIRAILINKRKSDLLRKMEEDLYQDALKRKNFEIITPKK